MDVLPDPEEDGEHDSHAHVAVQDNSADSFLKEHPIPMVVGCMLVIIFGYAWILKEEARFRRNRSST